ncbi:MAG: hypothetical protein WCL04_02195 [Verrucomicrobiota bacterium]
MSSKRIASALIVLCLLVVMSLWWAKFRPAEKAAAVPDATPPSLTTETAAEAESPVAASAEMVTPPAVDPAVLQAVAAAVVELQRQAETPPGPQIKTTRDWAQMMNTYERNRNGVLETDEIQAMQTTEPAKVAEALKWDLNGDGRIDGDELRAWRATLEPPL